MSLLKVGGARHAAAIRLTTNNKMPAKCFMILVPLFRLSIDRASESFGSWDAPPACPPAQHPVLPARSNLVGS